MSNLVAEGKMISKDDYLKSSIIQIKDSIYNNHEDETIDYPEDHNFWKEFPFCGHELKYFIKQLNYSHKEFAKRITKIVLDGNEIDRRYQKSEEEYARKLKNDYFRKHRPDLLKRRYEEVDNVTISRSFIDKKFAMGWRLLKSIQDMNIMDEIISESYSNSWLVDTRTTFFIENKDEFFELYEKLLGG